MDESLPHYDSLPVALQIGSEEDIVSMFVMIPPGGSKIPTKTLQVNKVDYSSTVGSLTPHNARHC